MRRLYCILLAMLMVVLPAASSALAESAPVSHIEALQADANDGGSLFLSWTELSEGPQLYTLTLCNNQTQACQLAGTTVSKAFTLDYLDAETSYTFHVGTADGNALELTLATPERAAEAGENGAASALYAQANESVVRDIAVARLDDNTLFVSWTEDTPGAFRYTLSLCETEGSQPVFQGTTASTSFVITAPENSPVYSIQIGTAEETTVSYVLPVPAPD